MPDSTKQYEMKILKHELMLLNMEQERYHKLLQNYENRDIPEDAEFVQKLQREVNLRDRRIRKLKDQIEALENE
jgi:hypothetical protein